MKKIKDLTIGALLAATSLHVYAFSEPQSRVGSRFDHFPGIIAIQCKVNTYPKMKDCFNDGTPTFCPSKCKVVAPLDYPKRWSVALPISHEEKKATFNNLFTLATRFNVIPKKSNIKSIFTYHHMQNNNEEESGINNHSGLYGYHESVLPLKSGANTFYDFALATVGDYGLRETSNGRGLMGIYLGVSNNTLIMMSFNAKNYIHTRQQTRQDTCPSWQMDSSNIWQCGNNTSECSAESRSNHCQFINVMH